VRSMISTSRRVGRATGVPALKSFHGRKLRDVPKDNPGGGGGSRPDAPRAGSGPVRLLRYRFSMDTIRRPISGAGTDPTSLKYRIFNDREPWLQGAPLVVVVEL